MTIRKSTPNNDKEFLIICKTLNNRIKRNTEKLVSNFEQVSYLDSTDLMQIILEDSRKLSTFLYLNFRVSRFHFLHIWDQEINNLRREQLIEKYFSTEDKTFHIYHLSIKIEDFDLK